MFPIHNYCYDDKELQVFNGQLVVELFSETPPHNLSDIAPFINPAYQCAMSLDEFCIIYDTTPLQSLLIGNFGGIRSGSDFAAKALIDDLLNCEEFFPNLKALFIGATESADVSDICFADMSFLLNYYSQLEYFKAHGDGNFFIEPIKHNRLKKLVLETTHISPETITALTQSDIPNLSFLELWLSTNDCLHKPKLVDFEKLFAAMPKHYPKLKHLALRNSHNIDVILTKLVKSPIIHQLESLDLSLGTLGTKGAKTLLSIASTSSLQSINIMHHYIGSNKVIAELHNHFEVLGADQYSPEYQWNKRLQEEQANIYSNKDNGCQQSELQRYTSIME